MTFNSLDFLFFVVPVYLLFRAAPKRWRWLVLLGASYAFYASLQAPQLVVALLVVTGVSYGCARGMGSRPEGAGRQRLFWCGCGCCLLVLALARYLPALLGAAPQQGGQPLAVTIGVSYFSFQAISYLADVYLELVEPEPHLGRHALYLAFFPKLLQGPIERAGVLLPQLKRAYRFEYQGLREGLLLFAWGLFKKVVIADRLSGFVAAGYDDVAAGSGLSLLMATYLFAIQLYCDFSGYTDMALGTARLFNVRLTPNFNQPYLATSVADFWRRWHISFSRWIFDYLFQPLQLRWRDGRRLGTSAALLVTFLASGLWHGASWCFLAWGGLHGCYLALALYTGNLQKRVFRRLNLEGTRFLRLLRICLVFHLVCLAWIFFRANSLADAGVVLAKIAGIPLAVPDFATLRSAIASLGMNQADLGIVACCISFAAAVSLSGATANAFEKLFSCRTPVRWGFYVTLSLFIILLAQMENVPYLYFRF
jgi:D-alanyl-lipoteichoic acid acyltransferase DltB (MBOAT superfamily)